MLASYKRTMIFGAVFGVVPTMGRMKAARNRFQGAPRRHARSLSGLWERMKDLRHPWQPALVLLAALQILQFHAYGQQPVAQPVVFHSIASIRSLSFEQANVGLPALIRGVVTLSVEHGLVVHDTTEGIWVYWDGFANYAPGDEVEVQGTIGPGKFAPVVSAASVRKLGIAPLPKPLAVTFKQLSSGDFDAQYVTLTGSIRSVGRRENAGRPKHLIMRIDSGDGTLMATLPGDADEPLDHMLDGTVRITATAMSSKNNNRQLVAPILAMSSLQNIVLLHPPSAEPWSTPLLPIGRLMQWRSGTDLHHRVHVAGTITYYRPGESLVIEDHGSALYARTDQSRELLLGDRVDMLGFPAQRDSGPILEDAIVRRVATGAPLAPAPVKLANLCSGNLNYNLISTEGMLVQQLHGPSQRTLLLRDGSNLVEAELDGGPEPKLRSIHEGSIVSIRGIIALRVSRAWNYDVEGAEKVHCRILLRSESDATVVQMPTWWTVPHAIYVALSLAVLALLLLLQIIRSLYDRGRLRAVLAERERLAHELHDTLAQSFAGIGFQLQAIRREIPRDLRNLEQQVDLARDLVRHSHKEARRTLSSYNAETNERFDLLQCLDKSARKMAEGGAVDITASIAGDPRPLRPAVATALLRIGQESIANAIRHADPTHLGIALFFDENRVTLSVTDDGTGFVESGDLLGFGLRGMRKRAAAVSATFEISSAPGNGTQISVVVPGQSAFGFSGIRQALRHYLWEPLIHAHSEE
jgi:signal transduction histidine kinase